MRMILLVLAISFFVAALMSGLTLLYALVTFFDGRGETGIGLPTIALFSVSLIGAVLCWRQFRSSRGKV